MRTSSVEGCARGMALHGTPCPLCEQGVSREKTAFTKTDLFHTSPKSNPFPRTLGVAHTGARLSLSQQGGCTHRLLLVVAALLEAAGVHGAAWLTTLPISSGWQNTSGFSLTQDSVWFSFDHLWTTVARVHVLVHHRS